MRYFIFWDANEQAEKGACGASSPDNLGPSSEGQEWKELLGGDIRARTFAIVDGTLTEIDRPISIEIARARRWAEALAYRNARQEGGCATPLGRVDTDADSQRKINGAATAAMIAQIAGQPFAPIGWTMADNIVVDHDGPAVIGMGMAVIAFLNSCQQAGTEIRDQIDAATDAAALASIDITAGYPA